MISKELTAASTRPLLLGILEDGESYGYKIIQRVRQLSEGELEWSEGMLYPVLHRLEREGLIESRWQAGESGRRRKYYALKKSGKKAVQAERDQWMKVHLTLNKLWGPQPCST